MPDATYPITGIQAGFEAGSKIVPVRMEVDDFYNSTDPVVAIQKDLLYQALSEFQNMDYSERLSYFQVAGIHGMPHVPWDAPGAYHPQYCEHATVLFGSWHRPYMLLFEQRLHELMVGKIIPAYPDTARDVMTEAANKFRLPYWDWAQKKARKDVEGNDISVYDLPLIVKAAQVQVTKPEGGLTTIKNPFFNFAVEDSFGEYNITPVQINDEDKGEPYEAIPFDRTRATSRGIRENPNKAPGVMNAFVSEQGIADNKNAAEDIEKAYWYQQQRAGITGHWSLREAVHRLLQDDYFESYSQFVTAIKPTVKDGKLWLSLEAIHNNLHNWTGGLFGHMGNVPVAAFDPIFYLHHANIDRILAIWQTLNDDKWFKESHLKDPKSDETIRVVKPTDPLAPFHSDDQGNFHTANSVRYVEALGYTYPEIQHVKGESREDYLARVKKTVFDLYAPEAGIQLTLSNHDVLINVEFEKFALGGVPFTVSVVLEGQVIGQVHNFSFVSRRGGRNSKPACVNCRNQQDANLVLTGQVFATHSLVRAVKDKGKELDTLSKDDIRAYFKEHLSYKVTTPTNDNAQVPGLKVTPVVGRRKVNLAGGFSSTRGVPGDHSITGVLGLPAANDVLKLRAHYNDDGTIQVHDIDDHEQVSKLKLGKWDVYEDLFAEDS